MLYSWWGIVIGLIIVLFGVSLLLKELFGIVIPVWPIVLIISGTLIIIKGLLRRSWLGTAFGLVIVLFGVSPLLEDLYGVGIPVWPIVVIAVGILIVVLSMRKTHRIIL